MICRVEIRRTADVDHADSVVDFAAFGDFGVFGEFSAFGPRGITACLHMPHCSLCREEMKCHVHCSNDLLKPLQHTMQVALHYFLKFVLHDDDNHRLVSYLFKMFDAAMF